MTPKEKATRPPLWRGLLTAATCLVAALPAFATPTACPAKADFTQQADNVPDGFTPYVGDARHLLRGIGISDGPPNAKVFLLPSSTRRQGRGRVSTWLFSPNEPRGIWVCCFYENTSIVLSFPLPITTKQCEVLYSEINIPTGFTCK